MEDSDVIENQFEKFQDEENLSSEELKKVIETYIYDERMPLKDEIAKTLKVKRKYLEQKVIILRVLDKVVAFVERFYNL